MVVYMIIQCLECRGRCINGYVINGQTTYVSMVKWCHDVIVCTKM